MGLVTQKIYFKTLEIFHSMFSKYDQIKIESNNKILSRSFHTLLVKIKGDITLQSPSRV